MIIAQIFIIFATVISKLRMNRPFKRQLWLLNTLLRYKKLSFKELQSKWKDSYLNDDDSELSLRTFHGHKDSIEGTFPVQIKCDSNDGYSYYVVKDSPQEQDSMLEWMLNCFNIAEIVGDAKKMHDRVLLEEMPGGTEFLEDVIRAMQDYKEIHIVYKSYKHSNPYDCHFQPYAMKVIRQRYYVLGNLIESKGLRTIALDRIMSLEITRKTFSVPEDFSAKEYFRNSVGIWVGKDKPEKVVLRSSPVMAEYLRSLPLHWSQKEINKTNKYVDFQYKLNINHELVLKLLGLGKSIKILTPRKLINDIFKETQRISSEYEM